MTMTVLNTLTRQREPLRAQGEVLTMYNCGPTVYGPLHIGNARNAVVFDVIHRYLESRGFAVRYVQNITDLDDKILRRAKTEGISWQEVAEKYTAMYREDAARLRILPPDVQPLATEHIPQMVDLIGRLVAQGVAYHVGGGDVYFRIEAREPSYGKLSGRKVDELQAGARVEVDQRKRHPLDFVLWKASKPGEPTWPSPWGPGRPGWHIECSVMAMVYLGDTIDVHGGGIDLVFPHHENEIAQSEAATGKPFARYWLHNGLVELKGTKMSKSLGNVTIARELLKLFDPEVIRHFLLSAHYHAPLDYTASSMVQAQHASQELANTFWRLHDLCSKTVARADGGAAQETGVKGKRGAFPLESQAQLLQQRFHMALHDDFNTAAALGHVFTIAGEVKQVIGNPAFALTENIQRSLRSVLKILFECTAVLGLDPKIGGFSDEVWRLIQLREEARRRKDYATADQLRTSLFAQGITLEDTPSGTIPLRLARS